MPADKNIFARFNKNKIFVETGSFIGGGINQAYHAGYRKIISIELSPHYYDYCKKLFGNYSSFIHLHLGDSGIVLGDIISGINEPITFWLDGHYSGGSADGIPETAGAGSESPLMKELDMISLHSVKNHAIMIDDVEMEKLDEMKKKILSINPDYVFELATSEDCLKDSILLAWVPEKN